METQHIRCDIKDKVAVLTIYRPESLNALNTQVVNELDRALHEMEAEPTVKIVVLTGAGDRAFVAGGDIKEMAAMDVQAARVFSRNGQLLVTYMETMTKPVLAAVNGYALGGGLELALACDFIYAGETARFGLPEVTLGLLPGFGGTQNLARWIGPARAKEMIFTGRVLTAREALEWGLVNAVYPGAELLDRTLETAARIANNGTVAIASSKQAMVRGLDQAKAEGFRIENDLFARLFATDDRKEGLQAFLEKRKAEFRGR